MRGLLWITSPSRNFGWIPKRRNLRMDMGDLWGTAIRTGAISGARYNRAAFDQHVDTMGIKPPDVRKHMTDRWRDARGWHGSSLVRA